MRLVDKCDMQVGSVECVRKSLKWYKKMFMHIIDITVLNCYNLWMVKTGKKTSLRLFQKSLIRQLMSRYGKVTPVTPRRSHTQQGPPDRLQAKDYLSRHFLEHTNLNAAGKYTQRRCLVCAQTCVQENRRRKGVCYQCHECKVPLCPTPCFKIYHTKAQY